MSEDWKTAFEAWPDLVGEGADLFGRPAERGFRAGFRAGYLAHAETVERLREALERIAHMPTPYGARFVARDALADLQPKETR